MRRRRPLWSGSAFRCAPYSVRFGPVSWSGTPGANTAPGRPAELVAAARWGGAVGCVSALILGGVPLLRRPSAVHMLIVGLRTVAARWRQRDPTD